MDLDDLKAHLRILHGEEDGYLQSVLDVAIDQAAQYLDRPIPWALEGVEQPVPASVTHAVLMLAAELYENREASVNGLSYTVTPTVRSLLNPYRVGLGV
jgi:uncharacterized phage protein (predicted DNA packaging)